LKGRLFVGGVLPDRLAWMPWLYWDEPDMRHLWRMVRHDSPFVLVPPMRFFGVEKTVFDRVIDVTRQGLDAAAIEPVQLPEQTASLSLLRDGTVLGPARYFEPIDVVEI